MFGDDVEFETIFGNQAIINEIYERKNYLKRPKVSNITQVIFVISPKSPKTNFLMLDKELCYAKYIGVKQVLAINKIYLDETNAEEIFKIYKNSGYKVIMLEAQKGEGIENLKKVLKNNTTVFAGSSGVRKINNHKSNLKKTNSTSRRHK